MKWLLEPLRSWASRDCDQEEGPCRGSHALEIVHTKQRHNKPSYAVKIRHPRGL